VTQSDRRNGPATVSSTWAIATCSMLSAPPPVSPSTTPSSTTRRSGPATSLERLITWLAERGEATYVEDVTADTEEARGFRSAFGGYLEEHGAGSLCLIPLKDEEGRLGAFYMESESPWPTRDG